MENSDGTTEVLLVKLYTTRQNLESFRINSDSSFNIIL